MSKGCIIFLVLNEYDDLGTGYISAVLNSAGYKTKTIDVREDSKLILKSVNDEKPLAIGFSVIYQYHIMKFSQLARFLREERISCHFTAGGHYATIRPGELFDLIPELDSIIRGEGEYPMLGLADALSGDSEWQLVENIVYRKDDRLVLNPVRHLNEDLDSLPLPVRTAAREYAFGRKYATLLAGRGCMYKCSFCNLMEFYAHFEGQARRTRNPENVAGEVEYLYRNHDCSVFLFQDDCFPLNENLNPGWALKFCDELEKRNLVGKIIWKFNCRPDEINEQVFERMRQCGLFLVFIGIEDGTDSGLEKMNKNFNTLDCLRGINILRKLGIGFDYGFMLFQPSTTFLTLRENLDYLRRVCSDGYAAVTFLKMVPYYATRIEKELIDSGRIRGPHGSRDYNFTDDRLTQYFEFVSNLFSDWNSASDGLVNISKWARNYLSVFSFFSPYHLAADVSLLELRNIIKGANSFIIDTMEELASLYSEKDGPDTRVLRNYRRRVKTVHNSTRLRINSLMFSLISVSSKERA